MRVDAAAAVCAHHAQDKRSLNGTHVNRRRIAEPTPLRWASGDWTSLLCLSLRSRCVCRSLVANARPPRRPGDTVLFGQLASSLLYEVLEVGSGKRKHEVRSHPSARRLACSARRCAVAPQEDEAAAAAAAAMTAELQRQNIELSKKLSDSAARMVSLEHELQKAHASLEEKEALAGELQRAQRALEDAEAESRRQRELREQAEAAAAVLEQTQKELAAAQEAARLLEQRAQLADQTEAERKRQQAELELTRAAIRTLEQTAERERVAREQASARVVELQREAEEAVSREKAARTLLTNKLDQFAETFSCR